jgi:hypothetical protein
MGINFAIWDIDDSCQWIIGGERKQGHLMVPKN